MAVAFRCTTCNTDLLAPMDGGGLTLQTHREIPHLKCEDCNRCYTPRRREDHDLMYHSHRFDLCSKTFTKVANLSRHKNKVHRRYQCPFCTVSRMNEFHNGPAALQNHVERTHHGKAAHHCNDCNSVYATEGNCRRHMAIVHKKQCVYSMKSMVVSHVLQPLHSFDSTWQQPIINMCVIFVGTCLHLVKAYTDIRQNIASVDMCVYPVTETFKH